MDYREFSFSRSVCDLVHGVGLMRTGWEHWGNRGPPHRCSLWQPPWHSVWAGRHVHSHLPLMAQVDGGHFHASRTKNFRRSLSHWYITVYPRCDTYHLSLQPIGENQSMLPFNYRKDKATCSEHGATGVPRRRTKGHHSHQIPIALDICKNMGVHE